MKDGKINYFEKNRLNYFSKIYKNLFIDYGKIKSTEENEKQKLRVQLNNEKKLTEEVKFIFYF